MRKCGYKITMKITKKQKSGYFGIGIYHPKTETNIGTLWRSAYNFGADFIFVIGKRYKSQCSDTTKTDRHIPLYEYEKIEDLKNNLPRHCEIIYIEQSSKSTDIKTFKHPKQCIYVLGAEDNGIPESIMKDDKQVHIDTPMCLNVAVAGSIIMFDRLNK